MARSSLIDDSKYQEKNAAAPSVIEGPTARFGAYVGRLARDRLCGLVDVSNSSLAKASGWGIFKYDLAVVDRMLPEGRAREIVTALGRTAGPNAINHLTAKEPRTT